MQADPNDPQAAFEAFQGAGSPDAMRQAVAQFPELAQLIPTIEQVIQTQVPPEARPAFEQRLAWLRQIVGEGGGATASDEQQQMEAAVQQLVGLYQQHGEAGLRQVLGQQGMTPDQIEQLIAVVKQALGEA